VTNPSSDFENVIASAGRGGMLSDIWHHLRRTRKWWLGPLTLIMLALGVMMLLTSTAVAPFIYTLF
jgi:uncharacterized protein DUF5989